MEKKQSKAFFKIYPLAYGIGLQLIGATVATYFSIFMTDTFGVPAAAASIIMFIATLWDAINDPIMGTIADRTHNRFGRYRGYFLFIPILLAIVSVLLFLAPSGLSTGAKIVYTAVTYIAYGMLVTAITMPTIASVPANTTDDGLRNRTIMIAVVLMSLSFSIVSTFTTKMTALTNGSYAPWVALYGVILIVTYLIMFRTSKEKYLLPIEKKSLLKDYKRILKHKDIIPVILVWCLSSLGYGLMFGSSVYYMMYYIQRPDLIAAYMGIVSVGSLLSGIIVAPILLKLFKKVDKAFQIAYIMTAILYAVLFFFGKNIQVLFIVSFIATLCATTCMTYSGILINDMIDYLQLKEGASLNGTVAAIKGFSEKCGSTLNNSGVLAVLAITGYVAGAIGGQPDSVLVGIRLLRFGIPAITCVIVVICLQFYPVEKCREQIASMKQKMREEKDSENGN